MKSYIVLFIFSSALFSSCGNNETKTIESDSSKVLAFAIRAAFKGYLPDKPTTRIRSNVDDSILFISDSKLLPLLPMKVDTIHFKILPEEEICSLLLRDTILGEVRNYLKLREFTKTDSGYYVYLQSLSCLKYGGGGTLGLYVIKQQDSIYIKSKSSSSIN